ncbi:uncharacterized protein LOC110033436 isoform X1 [Phalaenopsis equestris]|uniref:uncharacterized protein LOC110033436 isoform X1 n=1 Tax=Phalaenopsis equestris TaxID=78828 RepID=UPI0009E50F91|nr:uncharacterized protein LOC110033436 isoform X1 [Phalaenopsis equestris]
MAGDAENLILEGDRLPTTSTTAPGTPLLQSSETDLDRYLRRLEVFLSFLSFHSHSSLLILLLCTFVFLLLGVAIPLSTIILTVCPHGGCDGYRIERLEISVFVFRVLLAAVSLACVSRNLYKYGIRRFLFVDQHHGQADRFQKEYVHKIQEFFFLLLWWMLPCFAVKVMREILRFGAISHDSTWKAVVVLLFSIMSWIYLTTVFLSSCLLFNLVINLQVIHFEDYCRLLERDMDTLIFFEEHIRLRYNLSKISHRFRAFLLSVFLFVSASQFVALIQITGYNETISFTNSGDLAVASVVQVVGVVLLLHSAAKMSHRAQGIASVACKWHALLTCSSTDTSQGRTNSSGNLDGVQAAPHLLMNYSESDLESLDNVSGLTNTRLVSYMSTYHKRQALAMYLQTNAGGITIFGWIIDRIMMNTIFFLELTLVLFVLGKTIVFTSK